MKFVILLHKVLFNYYTLWDLYASVINPDRIDKLLREGEAKFYRKSFLVEPETYLAHPELASLPLEFDKNSGQRCPASDESRSILEVGGIAHEIESEVGGSIVSPDRKRKQFESVRLRFEPKLRTSVVDGISAFFPCSMTIPASGTRWRTQTRRFSKNKDGRTLPILEGGMLNTFKALRAEREKTGSTQIHVFLNKDGKPLQYHHLRKEWDDACTRVGLPGLLFHDLRRSAVRNLRRAGVTQLVARQFSGHKTDAVFNRYNISDFADLKEAATKLRNFLGGK